MSSSEARETVIGCVGNNTLCRTVFTYEQGMRYLLPVAAGERYFMSAVESGFRFDGFEISRFDDLSSARMITGGFADIAAREGLFDGINVPPVDMTSMSSICRSLIKLGCSVIIELDSEDSRSVDFLTGQIVTCGDEGCAACLFDLNAVWARTPIRINYGNIRRLVFGSGSLSVFDKYLPPCPIR